MDGPGKAKAPPPSQDTITQRSAVSKIPIHTDGLAEFYTACMGQILLEKKKK